MAPDAPTPQLAGRAGKAFRGCHGSVFNRGLPGHWKDLAALMKSGHSRHVQSPSNPGGLGPARSRWRARALGVRRDR